MARGVASTGWSSGCRAKHSSSAARALATSGSLASGSPSAAFSTSPIAPSDLHTVRDTFEHSWPNLLVRAYLLPMSASCEKLKTAHLRCRRLAVMAHRHTEPVRSQCNAAAP